MQNLKLKNHYFQDIWLNKVVLNYDVNNSLLIYVQTFHTYSIYTEYRKSHLKPDVRYVASTFKGLLRHSLYTNIVYIGKIFLKSLDYYNGMKIM